MSGDPIDRIVRPEALRSLVASGILLTREQSHDDILRTIAATARQLAGAKYAALGVNSENVGGGLERFITVGVDDETVARIGKLPAGLGVLGELITASEPLRLKNVADHPKSVGFPTNHPPMSSFLGVGIRTQGKLFGSIYLTEKVGAPEFTDEDEAIIIVLAEQAGVAIENERLLKQVGENAAHELRRAVLRRTIEAQEEERKRIARELHDETGQSLTGVLLALRLFEKTGLPPQAKEQVERLREQVAGALREVRSLAVRLRPSALDDMGLAAGIERLARELQVDDQLRIGVQVEDSPVRHDTNVETVVYRLVQEALTNVIKHSGAHVATVTVEVTDGRFTVEIVDDGSGFETDESFAGVGLIGMRERVALVGGELEISSVVGSGTRVRATIPTFV